MNIKIDKSNIDEYYNKINTLMDSYTTWNVKPSALKNYLKPGSKGLKNFIESNSLDNIEGIERIIKDIIEDREGVEKDTIKKFESFITENVDTVDVVEDKVFNNIEKSDIRYEKILSDLYRVSLSHVEEVDTYKHTYKIDDMGKKYSVVILSNEDIKRIKSNIINLSYEIISKKDIHVTELALDIDMSGLISKEVYVQGYSKKLEEVDIKEWIGDLVSHEFKTEKNGYYIWENEEI